MNGHPENRPRPLGSYDPGETFLLGWGERAAVVAAARQLAAALSADELSEVGLQSARIGLPYAVTDDRHLVLPDAQACVRWLEQLSARLGAGGDNGSPQISYAELHVTAVYWPDFRVADLHRAIEDYAGRNRRFGALDASNS